MKVTAARTRITTPPGELVQQVQAAGWSLAKLEWDNKLRQFVAEATSPNNWRLTKTGPDESLALASLLSAIYRRNLTVTAAQLKVGMWNTDFHNQVDSIAEAYAKAPAYDPKAAPYWKELGDDSLRRLETLQNHLQILRTDHPVPYLSAQDMLDDVYEKKRYQLSMSNLDHPVWSADQAAAFRAVHDILGRAVSGGGFGIHGANRAFGAHAPLLSPTAQAALFTEAVARPAFRHVYHVPDIGKIATFPEFIEREQERENKPGHRGIHPSQSIIPYKAPSMLAKTAAETLLDPNSAWSSGVEPGYPNAFMHHDDPLEGDKVMDNASLVDTGWSDLTTADGMPDRDRMKQAIVNAFRVVLLSPRKDLRWNAVHYQDIASIPASVQDPKVYWDTLEQARRAWNTAQGIDPEAHMIYFKFLKPFESIMWQMHPELGFDGAKKKAKETLFNWWTEEQERIEAQDREKPADKQKTADEIERRANEALARRLKQFIKDKTNPDVDVHEDPEPISLFGGVKESIFGWGDHGEDFSTYEDPIRLSWKSYRDWGSNHGLHTGYLADRMHQLHTAYTNDKITPERFSQLTDELYQEAQQLNVPSDWIPIHENGRTFFRPEKAYVQSDRDLISEGWRPQVRRGINGKYVDPVYSTPQMAAKKGNGQIYEIHTPGPVTNSDPTYLGGHRWWPTGQNGVPPERVRPVENWEITGQDGPSDNWSFSHTAAGGQYNLLTGEEANKYGAFMGTHLKAIAQISQHADEILDAALQDVKAHDGTGHHFRAKVLQLGVSGVGPKVCSFAWLLLQPMTSQLGTIDTHMMDVLGHHYEKEMNNRDYFKFERELAAGRDAAGYSHIPLGAFQWGMWDHKRTGPGSHQDHSAMRVLDPVSHTTIDWVGKAQNLKGESWHNQAPDWWQTTKPARDSVAEDWDQNIAPNFPQNAVPFQVTDQSTTAKRKTRMATLRANTGLSTSDIWKQYA